MAIDEADRARINNLRTAVQDIAGDVLAIRKTGFIFGGEGMPEREAVGEAIANVMLAYRHLEDARMRLGKAIQALDGGVSVYDK